MAENDNNVIAPIDEVSSTTKVLIAVTKKSDSSKLAVSSEYYESLDKRSYNTDGIIIRDEENDVNLLIAPTEATKVFGEGPEDILASDKRRKNYTNPTMSELDGKWRTDFLLSNHATHYDDNCAICYCRDYGQGWWMPSGGEMELVKSNKEEVNTLLAAINGTQVSNGTYWLSTQYSKDYSWHLDMSNGMYGFWLSKTNSLLVRPMNDATDYQEIENEE